MEREQESEEQESGNFPEGETTKKKAKSQNELCAYNV